MDINMSVYNNSKEMSKTARIIKGPPANEIVLDCSVGQFFLEHLRKHSNRIFEIDAETGQFQTNKEILERSVKLAEILKRRNIKLEDKISIAAENHRNWFVAALASIYVGAVVAPFNPSYTELEMKHVLNISKPRIIFVSRKTEKLLSKIVVDLSWRMELIELDDEALTSNVPTLKSLLETTDYYTDPYRYIPIDIGDNKERPVLILCSSGTTGLPKGVLLSHQNLLNFTHNIHKFNYLDITQDERILLFLPLYHGYGFGIISIITLTGSTLVRIANFSMELLFTSIQRYRITFLPIVPSVLIILAKHPAVPSYDFRSVKKVLCGAAPLPKELLLEAKKRLNLKSITNAYGMTELSIVIGFSDKSGENDNAISNLMPGIQCKVINPETFETLGPMQPGELCIKGEHILMLGYYGNRKATDETIDNDGWLHTGDVCLYDKTGKLFIVDRLKELIKYKGYQVSPVEIEVLLLSHPAVKDVAVTSKLDENSGELPMAFIVKQPDVKVTAQEIADYVKRQMSSQKWLRGGVRFIDAIPRNSTGKVMRRELRRLASNL
ncbi:4-coumarate--CoA ligase 1-like isoform X2 [Vespa mandarinia]|uniref:4-coumarate--CoA ligase 1-like isoform X2 n=1 Tax=Vespa mandarinia TaxID=7446 RepID=UPI001609AB53|nr:4-coumarate--CoA ligase 1-like isoform X2 [Vespa mandarinia]